MSEIHPLLVSNGHKPRKGVVKTCPVCAKEFYRRPSLAHRVYCSEACSADGHRAGPKPRCVECGKEFVCTPYMQKHRNIQRCSKECQRKELSRRVSGEKSPFYIHGKSPLLRRIRYSAAMKRWRASVFERDNWTCQECGARSAAGTPVTLNADHIKPFALYPDLRLDVSNGRTLCAPCHRKTPTFGEKTRKLMHGKNLAG